MGTQWTPFIERLHLRLNQLDLQNIIKARLHMHEVIRIAVLTFSRNILEANGTIPKQKKSSFAEVSYEDYTTRRR